MDEINDDEVMKILASAKFDVDGIFDEKARSDYVSAIAKIYDASVRKQALEAAEKARADENRFREKELENERKKVQGETASRIVDSVLKFVGVGVGAYVGLANLDLFKECWQDGMNFERDGVFSSSMMKDLRHNLKLENMKLKFW